MDKIPSKLARKFAASVGAMKELRTQLVHGRTARRLMSNASWLMAERMITMVVNLGVAILLARYLGPTDFGILNYVLALVALLGFLAYLGLDSTVTRRLAEHPERRAVILGTAFGLRIAGSATAFVLALGYSFAAGLDQQTQIMVVIIAAGMLFQPAAVVDFYFQSRLQSRHSATARTIASLATSAIKLAFIFNQAPLTAFAVAASFQHVLVAAVFGVAYFKHRDFSDSWRWNSVQAKELLRVSWPLALSAATGLIYLKIDQIMLGEMVDNAAVGVYSVAVRLSEVWWFVPTALAASFVPLLVESKKADDGGYERRLQRMYDLMVWSGVAIAVPITIVAYPAINLLFGAEFIGAAAMLQIHIWTCPAMFAGAVLARWSVMEGQEIFALVRNVIGAVLNVALNLLLIPEMGGLGAAVATLISYSATSYLACLFFPPARSQFVQMTASLLLPLRMIRKVGK